jgi:transposase
MGKRRYRAVAVKDVDVGRLVEALTNQRIVVAIDVAMEWMFAAVMSEDLTVHVTVKWSHPRETRSFLGLVAQLGRAGDVEVAMEPSGTYGDALRHALLERGWPVFRVSPKRTHDAAEVYDGVPSLHDAKSAAIIAKLHLDGASRAWPLRSEQTRALAAAAKLLGVHEKAFRCNRNRLAAGLARYWPEVRQWLALDSATLLELLVAYGGPEAVAQDSEGARELMRRTGRAMLAAAKVDAVAASAEGTLGVPMVEEERAVMMALAREARRSQLEAKKARRRLEALSAECEGTKAMAPAVGHVTAAVLYAAVGDPSDYGSAKAYLKATGLNLREHSSGQQKGGLHITKRGSGLARMYLYMAAMRLIHRDPVVRAWYERKVARQGGSQKTKAVVAVMRKLVMALWHVARGAPFDGRKLFDVSRLKIGAAM